MHIEFVTLNKTTMYYVKYNHIFKTIHRVLINGKVAKTIRNFYDGDIDPIVLFKIACSRDTSYKLPCSIIPKQNLQGVLIHLLRVVGPFSSISMVVNNMLLPTKLQYLQVADVNNERYIVESVTNTVINANDLILTSNKQAVNLGINKIINDIKDSIGDLEKGVRHPNKLLFAKIADDLNVDVEDDHIYGYDNIVLDNEEEQEPVGQPVIDPIRQPVFEPNLLLDEDF